MYIHKYEKYFSSRFKLEIEEQKNDLVIKGCLHEINGDRTFKIINAIPRFVKLDNSANNFDLQWNTFRSTQLDSNTGVPMTEKRFLSTKWDSEDLKGKKILEVGSGAGRFTEKFLKEGAELVTFDYSNAIQANFDNNFDNGNGFFFQGNLYDIPFDDNYFDYVFCYGVLQHTPEPEKALAAIYSKLKPKGKIAIDWYIKTRKISPWSTPKYFWRPITRNMNPDLLLKIVKFYIPIYLPIDTAIKKIFGQTVSASTLIPCFNHLGFGLTYKQRKEWAILDTYDALSATYDYPKTLDEVKEMINLLNPQKMEAFLGGNGVVALSTK